MDIYCILRMEIVQDSVGNELTKRSCDQDISRTCRCERLGKLRSSSAWLVRKQSNDQPPSP